MAKFSTVFVASVQYIFGIYIFKKPELSGYGPLVSSLIVLLSMLLVLWSLPLYPNRLRKLVSVGRWLAEYLIAVFLIEYIMGCFWFPLEATLLALLPKLADTIEDSLMWIDSACHIPCDFFDFLRKEGVGMFMSYLLSFIILLAALHATRLINLSLLTGYSGVYPFLYDINRRFRHFLKSSPLNLGFRFRPRRPHSRDYCASDDENDGDFGEGERLTTENDEYHYYRRH